MHKVVHILACGKSGGIETLVAEYAKKSSHNNYFVFVWEDGYYEQQIRECGCNTYLLDAGRTGSFKATQELIAIIKSIKPDVIVTHHGSPMIRVYVTLLSFLFRRIPVLMYVHCDAKDELNGSNGAARKVINITAAKNAKRIIAISNYVKKSIIANFKARPEKIEVVYNGVNVSRFAERCLSAHDPVRLVFVGRLVKVKGVQIALEAIKICEENGYNLSFTIVGDGEYREQLEKTAKELAVDKNCSFVGTRRDVPQILANSDVFVHSCIWEEGFGIGIVEAMAAGKICVCSNSGAIPEIITDGVDGFLAEKGNPKALAEVIMKAIDNRERWECIQSRAIMTAHKFDMKKFVEQLDEVVEEVADER